MRFRNSLQILAVLVVTSLSAWSLPAKSITLRPPLEVDCDTHPIAAPREREVSELYAIAYNTWLRHLNLREKAVNRQPALNVNAWDEVPDSSWFTNRMGVESLTFPEILQGLEGQGPGSGNWLVKRVNDQGYTPKLDIEDSEGRRYVLKFDVPTALERNSGAERICTLILHAAGFNTPHNSIAFFEPDRLELDADSYYRNPVGKRQLLTREVLNATLARLRRLPDGRFRGLASLFLPGRPVGPFVYHGTRSDDPNDLIPHQLRRELRGLRVIASWINHVDVKDVNALDIFVADDSGRGYVKHYLLDFGSTMGSGDFVNGPYRLGHEYIFDGPAIGKAFLSLGFWRRPWDRHAGIPFPEIGYYDDSLFEPGKWKPNYPNLAFEAMNDADGYWGAKIVTAFSEEVIQEIAAGGLFSNPAATEYLEHVLKRRREAIGRYWFSRVTPLEEVQICGDDLRPGLRFRDLAVERGFAEPERFYRYWIVDGHNRPLAPLQSESGDSGEIPLPRLPKLENPHPPSDRFGRVPLLNLYVQAQTGDGQWSKAQAIVLGAQAGESRWRVLGWTHGCPETPP